MPTLIEQETEMESLIALLDTAETEDERLHLAVQAANALQTTEEKRERFGGYIAKLGHDLKFIQAERKRLTALAKSIKRQKDRLSEIFIDVILSKGLDRKGKLLKLDGITSRFSVRRNPPTVEITALSEVPVKYMVATLKMSGEQYEEFTSQLTPDLRRQLGESIVSLDPDLGWIHGSLRNGETVPGARITSKFRLVRE